MSVGAYRLAEMPGLVRITVCVLLGAVTTVAVSWWLAVRVVVPILNASQVTVEGALPDGGEPLDLTLGKMQRAWWCQIQIRRGLTVVSWEPVMIQTGFGSPTASGGSVVDLGGPRARLRSVNGRTSRLLPEQLGNKKSRSRRYDVKPCMKSTSTPRLKRSRNTITSLTNLRPE